MDTHRVLKILFFLVIVRPVLFLVVGFRASQQERLPDQGPAILVANHNSHLDTLAIMSLFSLSVIHKVRPVAAADYFLKGRLTAWFSTKIIGIIPLTRHKSNCAGTDGSKFGLSTISECLDQGDIVIFFPEGTRGEPEEMSEFKSGISVLAMRHPNIPVIPILLSGMGKVLPRGASLTLPFLCTAQVCEPLFWNNNRDSFLETLRSRFSIQKARSP